MGFVLGQKPHITPLNIAHLKAPPSIHAKRSTEDAGLGTPILSKVLLLRARARARNPQSYGSQLSTGGLAWIGFGIQRFLFRWGRGTPKPIYMEPFDVRVLFWTIPGPNRQVPCEFTG